MVKSKLKKQFLTAFLAVAMTVTSVNFGPGGAVTAHAADTTNAAVLANGDYYIVNAKTGKLLNGGNTWGTQASALSYGQLMTFTAVDAAGGVYNIDSHISNGGDSHYVGATGFVDGEAAALTIAKCEDGSFTIANSTGQFLTAPSGDDSTVVTYGEQSEYSKWNILTPKEYMADAVAKVKAGSDPVDVTSMILDSHTGRNNQYFSKWGSGFAAGLESAVKVDGANAKYLLVEKYNATFDFNQTIENVPNGVYQLSLQGFYRVDGSDSTAPVYYLNTATGNLKTVQSEGKENKVEGTWSTQNSGVYIPNTMLEASKCFLDDNAYNNDFIEVKVTDHTLKVGLKGTAKSQWVIWDNFTLKYKEALSDAEEAQIVTAKIDEIGTVEATDASKAKIDTARKFYDMLTDAQKALITEAQLKTLTDAEVLYENKKAAQAAIDKITAIGTVEATDESKAKIDAAREAYDALTDVQKELVTAEQLKVLTDAETGYVDKKAAAAVVEKITAIGEVSLKPSCKRNIDAARAAYDALTDAQKAFVTADQLKVLTDAEASYKNLHDNATEEELNQIAAEEVVDAIKAIGEVALDAASKAKIDTARELYDALTDAQKALVSADEGNPSKTLTDAEAKYKELKDAADKEAADACVAKINAIKDVAVTAECRLAIKAAREAYDALTEDQAALVTAAQLKVLTDAETAYAGLVAEPILANGDYYILNAATGGYLNGGNSQYYTQASVRTYGQLMTFAVSEDSNISYTIDSHYLKDNKKYLGNNGFLDNKEEQLKIEQYADGTFSITNNKDEFLTAPTEENDTTVRFKAGKSAESEWFILSREELIQKLSDELAVSPDNAVDATSLILDPKFDIYNQYYSSKWSGATKGGDDANQCAENYHKVFDATQTITNLPNGVYELSVQGFYRSDVDMAEDTVEAVPAVYYINETEKAVKTIESEGKADNKTAGWGTKRGDVYVPNSMKDASKCFTAGAYMNDPIRVTVTDHTLKVGLKSTIAWNWVIWDNFTLKMISLVSDEDEAKAALALINAIGEVEATDACKAKIDAARKSYDALTIKQKKLITDAQLKVLTDAETKYTNLTAVAAVVAKINAIGTVSLKPECKTNIDAARAAYNKLNDEQKELVTAAQLKVLTDAETEYNRLLTEGGQDAVDQAAADEAVEKINKIGTVEYTDACKAKIDDARKSYNALTTAQKAKVTAAQLKVLTDAETKYADLKAVAGAVEKINAIGTVAATDASKKKIDDARKAYDALTEDQKKLVTTEQLKVLTDAEAKYEELTKPAPEKPSEQLKKDVAAALEAADAEPLEDKAYTTDSLKAYNDALEELKTLSKKTDVTKKELEDALAALKKAEAGLTVKTEYQPTEEQLEELTTVVADAAELTLEDYVEDENWEAFQKALEKAQAVKSKANATKAQVEKAMADLEDAIANLTPVKEDTDKTKLAAAIKSCEKLQKKVYTTSTWKKFEAALKAAKTVNADEDATQEEIDDALKNLNAKKKALKKAVTKITITDKATGSKPIKIAAGKKVNLLATVAPAGANSDVTWTLHKNSKKLATITKKGVLTINKKTAHNKKVTVIATAKDGSKKTGTVTITVMKNAVTKVTLKAPKKLKAGKAATIKATVKTNGKKVNKALVWSVDAKSKKYASINAKGKLTTKKTGKGKKVTVTAKSTDGTNKSAKVTITLTK